MHIVNVILKASNLRSSCHVVSYSFCHITSYIMVCYVMIWCFIVLDGRSYWILWYCIISTPTSSIASCHYHVISYCIKTCRIAVYCIWLYSPGLYIILPGMSSWITLFHVSYIVLSCTTLHGIISDHPVSYYAKGHLKYSMIVHHIVLLLPVYFNRWGPILGIAADVVMKISLKNMSKSILCEITSEHVILPWIGSHNVMLYHMMCLTEWRNIRLHSMVQCFQLYNLLIWFWIVAIASYTIFHQINPSNMPHKAHRYTASCQIEVYHRTSIYTINHMLSHDQTMHMIKQH